MTLLVRSQISDLRGKPEAVDEFLEGREFPLLEGPTATFVYRGEADAVYLRHWVFGLPAEQPFERVEGTDLWHLIMEFPERSRVEYKIEVVRGDAAEWILDPLNPLVAHDPFGANSVCQGQGYETPDWSLPDPEARAGKVEDLEVQSRAFGEMRRVGVYVPHRLRKTRPAPLLIAHDGEDYVRYAALTTVLDNLIYRLEIPPIVVALTQSPDRLPEYGDDPRHARFLCDEVVPALEARYPIAVDPALRGLMGASFGAVAALSTAWRQPGRFGALLLQSGSFAFTDIGLVHGRGPEFDPVVEFMNAFREDPGRPAERVFMSCGIYESLIYENRSLVPLIQATGMDLRYREARDGHHWENWRDHLREALAWLFPGPLWMVYE